MLCRAANRSPTCRPASSPTEGLAWRVCRPAPHKGLGTLGPKPPLHRGPGTCPRAAPAPRSELSPPRQHSPSLGRPLPQTTEEIGGWQCSRRRRPSQATSHQVAKPARHICRSDRCHRPTPEPRSDVVPPRPAVTFQRPTFHGAPRLQPHLGDHIQRHLASTRVGAPHCPAATGGRLRTRRRGQSQVMPARSDAAGVGVVHFSPSPIPSQRPADQPVHRRRNRSVTAAVNLRLEPSKNDSSRDGETPFRSCPHCRGVNDSWPDCQPARPGAWRSTGSEATNCRIIRRP
jgi:hypothetical protein